MIVIDKEVMALNRFASRHYVIEKGEIVWTGTPDQLEADHTIQDTYLSV